MGLFGSIKDKQAQKKKKAEVEIKKYNDYIINCANKNRIAQIKHLDEYLDFPSIKNISTIVYAKVFCEVIRNAETNEISKISVGVHFYDENGREYVFNLPVNNQEITRVLCKIIPFSMEEGGLKSLSWNHGSDYDCDEKFTGEDVSFFKTLTTFLVNGVPGLDDTIKTENDVFVRKNECGYLGDKSLLYFYNVIKCWKENNFSELIGDYNLWKEKRDFILSYENLVFAEIQKRQLESDVGSQAEENEDDIEENEDDIVENFGEKGELNVEYALKWLPKEYSTIERNGVRIFLRNPEVSDEKQEFDHIVVGPNGVFSIETKYLKGNIKIDAYGNWSRTFEDGQTEGLKNPTQQVDRHHMVISSILSGIVEKDDIHDVICLAYDTCTIDGIDNSDIPVVKADMITRHIINAQSKKVYSISDIEKIIALIDEYRE